MRENDLLRPVFMGLEQHPQGAERCITLGHPTVSGPTTRGTMRSYLSSDLEV